MSITLTIDGSAYPYPSNASDDNWAAQQVAAMQALAAGVTESLTSPVWTAVSVFTNSWANSGGSDQAAGHTLLANGLVGVRGALTAGGGGPGASAFTLPSGRRPLTRFRIIQPAGASGTLAAAVLVDTDGTVVINAGVGSLATDIRAGTFLNFWFSIT